MKKLFLILMLALLPFQATWAAVAVYCQHENEVQTRHFGHHEHRHASEHVQAQELEELEEQKDTSFQYHADCVACHGLAAAMIISFADTLSFTPTSQEVALIHSTLQSISAIPPEKPQWVLAV